MRRARAARPRTNATLVGLQRGPQRASFPLSIEFNVDRRQAAGNGPTEQRTPIDQQQPTPNEASSAQTPRPDDEAQEEGPRAEAPLLKWSENDKNNLLGAFFYGYVIFQVPGGRAAELYGPKLLLLWLGLGTGLSSLVFPYAALFWPDTIWIPWTIRFVMGASQAGLFPAAYVLLCNWLPRSERSSWLAVPSAFGRFGTIAMNLIIPVIMAQYTWEWVFYASGLVTLAWTLLVVVFASDRPRSSWWLSDDELIYIESRMERSQATAAGTATSVGLSSLNLAGSTASGLNETKGKKPPAQVGLNWFKMLRSRPLLILALVMFTSEWSNMLLLVKLPGFLGPAMGMSLDEIGTFSSGLVLIYCVMYPAAGVMASRLEACQAARNGCMGSLRVRKLFEAMAQALQAAGCLVIALFEDKLIVLCALVAMMLGRSLVGGGQSLMPPELSKDYPGSVMALANSMANCAGIFGPMLLNVIVSNPSDYADWRNMWLVSAGVFVAGGVLFLLFADNRPQNYGRRPKLAKSNTTDMGQLRLPEYVPPAPVPDGVDPKLASDEIIRMSSFSRVSSEPQQQQQTGARAARRQWAKQQPPVSRSGQ